MNDITQLLLSHGEAALFVVVFLEQAGLPAPGGPLLIAAGALSAGGELNPLAAIAGTILACLIPDMIWFYLGRRGGHRILRLLCRTSLEPDRRIHQAQNLFVRHETGVVIISKLLPGISAVVPPMAGSFGLSAPRFLFLDTVASLIFAGFYMLVGFLLRTQLEEVLALVSRFTGGALGLLVGLVAVYVGYRYFRRHRGQKKTLANLPEISRARAECS